MYKLWNYVVILCQSFCSYVHVYCIPILASSSHTESHFSRICTKYNRFIVPNNAHHILSSIRIIYMYIYMHSLMLLYMWIIHMRTHVHTVVFRHKAHLGDTRTWDGLDRPGRLRGLKYRWADSCWCGSERRESLRVGWLGLSAVELSVLHCTQLG